eukprot:XP_011618397.1 PREDICTED: cerebellar degeneration-related protein 2-like [Takifugu rubripes]
MLTDTIVEEEFELKEEEPWYDRQDLEHDLQLAAELGKSLLERNKELEQGLQQMCSSNQEQLQEIEYLSKQVDVLRQVNDQHAKVYEQLDVAARELEQNNHKLVLDKKTAQQKIQGLVETVELLQTQVDELQRQLEDVRLSPGRRHWEPRAARSVSCLQELQNSLRYEDEPPDAADCAEVAWWEEERASLQHSLRALQTQFAGERARREELQREAQLLTGENAALEQQVSGMEACRVRVAELELEVEELRQLWESSSRPGLGLHLMPNPMLVDLEDDGEAKAAKAPSVLKRWGSERLLRGAQTAPGSPGRIDDHECSCARRSGLMKSRGISLLHEVDAQYSALQAKYEELLQRCPRGPQEGAGPREGAGPGGASHKSIQTADGAAPTDLEDEHQPEYKKLFKQIFSHIQKSKKVLENRGGPAAPPR